MVEIFNESIKKPLTQLQIEINQFLIDKNLNFGDYQMFITDSEGCVIIIVSY